MDLVVDTNVIVAALNTLEPHHKVSSQFFGEACQLGDYVIIPITVLWELGSTLIRQQEDTNILANRKFELNFKYFPVTWELWEETWQADKMVHIKGPDRIFVSIAMKCKVPLVTWDEDLFKRAPEFGIKTIKPDEYLSNKERT